jgi:hypothetical protein
MEEQKLRAPEIGFLRTQGERGYKELVAPRSFTLPPPLKGYQPLDGAEICVYVAVLAFVAVMLLWAITGVVFQ